MAAAPAQIRLLGSTWQQGDCSHFLAKVKPVAAGGWGGNRGKRGGMLRVVNEEGTQKPRDKGWFYENFVKEHTMEAKLARMQQESAERKGKIDTLFENSFRYTAWLEVHRVLTEVGQESITPADAFKLSAEPSSFSTRAVLLDVREAQDFSKFHAKDAKNAPLFRLIQGNDLKANLRRLGNALLTNFAGTERNPNFIALAEEAVGGKKDTPLVVMCGRGGTLETIVERKGKKFKDPDRLFGIASRSLKACYELREAGFTNVFHLKGGLNQWGHEDFPTEPQ